MNNLKKIVSVMLTAAALSSAVPVNISAEATDIRVFLNGSEISLPTCVEVFNDTAMVPAKTFLDNLGYYVEWNELFQTLSATKVSSSFVFSINNSEYTVNGNIKQTSAIPAIINNRVYIAVDDVVNNIGLSSVWDNDNRIINLEGTVINPTPVPLVKLSDDQIPKTFFENRYNNTNNTNNNNSNKNSQPSLSDRLRPSAPKSTPTPSATTTPTPSPTPIPTPTPVPTPTPTPKPKSPYECYSRYPTVPDIKKVVSRLDFLYYEDKLNSSAYYYSFERNERDDVAKMYEEALVKSGFDRNNAECTSNIVVYDRYDIKVIFDKKEHIITIKGTPNYAPTKGKDNAFSKTAVVSFRGNEYNNPIPFYESYLHNKTYVCKFVTTQKDAKEYVNELKRKASIILQARNCDATFMFKSVKVETQLLDYTEENLASAMYSATPAPTQTPKPTPSPSPTPTIKPSFSGYKKLGATPTPTPSPTPSPTPTPEPSPSLSPSPSATPLLDVSAINEDERKVFVIKLIP